MKLKKMIKDVPIKEVRGSKEVEISGVCANSKMVVPGNLFVARKGRENDGAEYIAEAVSGGAVAILTDIYDPAWRNVTQIIHQDPAKIEGLLAARCHNHPSQELFMIGVTGTNGKTTTSYLVKHFFDQFAGPCGLIGTIEYIMGSNRYQATRTTPDVSSNQKMLREMVLQGCHSAVMEVTSHALDQGRVDNIDFDIGIFTNLTIDHLDYHLTMEKYFEAKLKLFLSLEGPKEKKTTPSAIINADSPWHLQIQNKYKGKVFTYGIDNQADLMAKNILLNASGTTFDLVYHGKIVKCRSLLVGRFNVYNCLAAIATGLVYNRPLEELAELLSTFTSVPGRLEPVPNPLGLNIYVDFAHTHDALGNVLSCFKEIAKGKIITVFGCGGDRDHTKRPLMAEASEHFSDTTIVTSDNPRSESPEAICNDILKGFSKDYKVIVEIERRKAIEKAIDLAGPQDIVLIAGKGHENYQIFSHRTIEFDDRKVAQQICETKYAQNQRYASHV